VINIEIKYLPLPWSETHDGRYWTRKAEEQAIRYKKLISVLSCPNHPEFPNKIIVVPRLDGVKLDRNFCCEKFENEEEHYEMMYNL
jgi:hypothetical protein